MPNRKISPRHLADQIRRVLKDGGSTEHAAGVQWFFKDEIKSHGWYTATLRKAAVQSRRSLARERGMDFVVQVADQLFSGRNLEEKVFAVFLLENQTRNFGDREFQLVARPRIELGRPRRVGARSAGANDSRRPVPVPRSFSVGEVAESLAEACRLRGANSRHARKEVLFPNRAAFQSIAADQR